MDEAFGQTLDELDTKCSLDPVAGETPVQLRLKREQHMAGIVYQLVNHHPDWSATEQEALVNEEFTDRADGRVLPDIDTPETPKWGPFPGEEWGKPCNRAIGLIRVTINTWGRCGWQ